MSTEPLRFTGGWYCDSLVDGSRAVLFANSHLETHFGRVELDEGDNPLGLRVHRWNGVFYIAGQSHKGRGALLWRSSTKTWKVLGIAAIGINTVIFRGPHLLVSTGGNEYLACHLETGEVTGPHPCPLGSQGFMYVNDLGTPIPRDLSYGQHGLAEFTEIAGETYIGQGTRPDGVVAVQGERRVVLDTGRSEFIRVLQDGQRLAVSVVHPWGAAIWLLSLDDLWRFPDEVEPLQPIPRIDRACWFGFFAGSPTAPHPWVTSIPPQSLIGNCYLLVKDLLVRSKNGAIVAQYVAAEGPGQNLEDEIRKARERFRPVPVMAYIVRKAQNDPIPSADIQAIELYWQRGESLEAFERAGAAAIERYPSPWLVPQAFTSNTGLEPDLRAIVPVTGRLMRRYPKVQGLIAFSGSGRPTGIQEHPDAAIDWAELYASVTGTPSIVILPPPDPIEEPMEPAPSFDQWIRVEYPQVVDAWRYGQQQPPDAQPGAEWAAFITLRRFSKWIGNGEDWPLAKLIANERAQRPGGGPQP